MNYFGAISLFNGIVALLVALYVFSKDRKHPVYLSFSAFAFSVSLWSILYSLWQSQSSKEPALFLMRLVMLPCYFIPVAFLWFVLSLLEVEWRKKYLPFFLTVSLLFIPFNFSTLTIKDVVPRLFFPFWPEPGFLMHFFVAMFFLILLYCFYLLFQAWIKAVGLRRWQLKWVTLTTLLMWLGGSTNWLLWYGIPIPPIPNFFVGAFLILLAYAIIRRQLFDIDTVADYIQEARLSSLGILASSVFHEIKSPLFTASGYAESLLQNLKDKTSEEKLNKIIQQIERAADIVKQFSQFVRPSETEAKPEPIHISEVTDNVLVMIGGLLEKEKIKIEKQIDPVVNIRANRRHIEEILINLITNAYQAMPGGGTLKIMALQEKDCMQISISDTGCGMSQAELKRIFDPFYSTKKEQGMGLGLYIVKKLVERNGGRIKVASEAGKGTAFTLEFPALWK